MKTLRRTFMGLLAATAISTGAMPALAKEEVTLRLHQFLPEQAAVPAKVLSKWIENVETASNGRIKVQHYPAMSLGGTPPELYDQVVDGVADVVWTLPGYTPGRFPETEVFELPFMVSDPVAASRAYWKLGEETLMKDSMADTKVLGLWVHGPGVIHSKTPVESLEDLKGLKLRAPTRITTKLLTNLGAEAIGMPMPSVPENLSKGVISAAVVPWEVTAGLKISELVKNHTTFPDKALYTATFVLAMNKDKYESLPDDLKKVIDDNSGLEFSAMAAKLTLEADGPGLKIAQDLGNNIIELSDDEAQRWVDASQSTVDEWVAEMDAMGKDGQGLIDRANELMAEGAEQ